MEEVNIKTKLHKAFINGCLLYDPIIDINNINEYYYMGGNYGSHKKYFELLFPTNELPDFSNTCVCGHKIQKNCYISKVEPNLNFYIIGSCCINKFVHNKHRTCSMCRNTHKNKKTNLCNKCRIGHCETCHKKINENYKKCYKCKNN